MDTSSATRRIVKYAVSAIVLLHVKKLLKDWRKK